MSCEKTMAKCKWRLVIGCLAALPLAELACGAKPDRVYLGADASAVGGGGSGTGGQAGSSGGSGGTEAGKVCANDAECDDGNPCNGIEACAGKLCVGGTPLADDAPCSLGDAGGNDHVCLAGECLLQCAQDPDCDDGDVCSGVETCGPKNVCQKGTAKSCDDKNPCTKDECDAESGCFNPLIDADGDGHAADALGPCGDDCDDADDTVFTGAQELCDNKDNNCNGSKDELAPTWYADCDKDGFAPSNAQTVGNQCAEPPAPCTGSGAWVTVAPGPGTTDCWDQSALAHPFTAAENAKAWQSKAIGSAPTTVDFDYNCDGVEEKRWTTVNVKSTMACSFQGGGGGLFYCTGTAGWTAAAAPACGASSTYSYCTTLAGCARTSTAKLQECR